MKKAVPRRQALADLAAPVGHQQCASARQPRRPKQPTALVLVRTERGVVPRLWKALATDQPFDDVYGTTPLGSIPFSRRRTGMSISHLLAYPTVTESRAQATRRRDSLGRPSARSDRSGSTERLGRRRDAHRGVPRAPATRQSPRTRPSPTRLSSSVRPQGAK